VGTIVGIILAIYFHYYPKEEPFLIYLKTVQVLEILKEREQEIRTELSLVPGKETAKRRGLEIELDKIHEKQANLEEYKKKLEEALQGASKALVYYEKDFSPDRVKQAQRALQQGKMEQAEALFEEAVKTLPAKAAEAAFQLGVLAESRIDYLKAKEYYTKAVQLQPDNPQYLNALGKLQLILGHYGEAQQHLEHALEIREKTLGPEHPDVAQSLNNLALLYYYQGKYAAAEPLFQRALKINEKALGQEHPHVATGLNNLASLCQTQGKYAKAELLYQRSLKIREKALEPDHPHVATSLNNLASLYRYQGKLTEAEPLYQRALKITEQVLGPDHPDVAQSLNNMAELYWAQGKYTEAEPLHQRSLMIREKALGPDHPDVAQSLNNLAALYVDQGKYIEAEPLYQRALKIDEKALGSNHPSLATGPPQPGRAIPDPGKI